MKRQMKNISDSRVDAEVRLLSSPGHEEPTSLNVPPRVAVVVVSSLPQCSPPALLAASL